MQFPSRTAILLLRSFDDWQRARKEVGALIRHMEQREPGLGLDVLKGVWVDAQIGTGVPPSLRLPVKEGGTKPIPIVESVGVSGVWVLCWLEDVGCDFVRLAGPIDAQVAA